MFNIKIFCADGWTGTDIDSVLKLCVETFKIEWVDGQYQYSDISDLVVARWMLDGQI